MVAGCVTGIRRDPINRYVRSPKERNTLCRVGPLSWAPLVPCMAVADLSAPQGHPASYTRVAAD